MLHMQYTKTKQTFSGQKVDHVLSRDYDRNLVYVTLNSLSSNLNSVQPKLSAFYVDYIVATWIIPYMEISHDLVTK